jgi:hypothetical protein
LLLTALDHREPASLQSSRCWTRSPGFYARAQESIAQARRSERIVLDELA